MFSMLHELGFTAEELIEKTKKLKAPKGRCETYKVKDGFAVVDYAHNISHAAVSGIVRVYRIFLCGENFRYHTCGHIGTCNVSVI